MGKSYSFPPEAAMAKPFPKGSPQKSPGVSSGFNPKSGMHNHALNHASMDVERRLNPDAIHIDGIGNLSEAFKDLKAKVDLLMEAISLAHQRNGDGKCVEGCWSCRVEDTMRGIKVHRKIGGEE